MKATHQLSREAVTKFKAIYADEFGEEITNDEAQEMGIRLLRLLKLLLEIDSITTTDEQSFGGSVS